MTKLKNRPSFRRRTVLINVEAGVWPPESRVWPHLGIVFVGTMAKRFGYEVVLWDELIQGPAPLDRLIEEGDIVGLSLVTTGIDRGVVLARGAKLRGASCVVAGNDAARFRAPQILRIPDRPIDAVFTSDSLIAVHLFYRLMRAMDIDRLNIPHVATHATGASYLSNEHALLKQGMAEKRSDAIFIVPDLNLFDRSYWETVWNTYRSQYGHKHDRKDVKNALALLSHGCGRAGAGDACGYCTIGGVADVRIPEKEYLERTFAAYRDFGIDTLFNVADSSIEMGKLLNHLEELQLRFESYVMYGRAEVLAQRPELLDRWLARVSKRLVINCGMDSGDESVLRYGISKSPSKGGSRLYDNQSAIGNIKFADRRAHLHMSLIFGSPGETTGSCERSLELLQYAIQELGPTGQLDVAEGDIWWLNFGAACAEIFRSYDKAQMLASSVGNTISPVEWYESFGKYANELSVPWESEKAWYRFFTHIDLDEAQDYNKRMRGMMEKVPGAITGRQYNFKPPPA